MFNPADNILFLVDLAHKCKAEHIRITYRNGRWLVIGLTSKGSIKTGLGIIWREVFASQVTGLF